VQRLSGCHIVALDTESNSLYTYTDRVCLIQISIPGGDYLVDPLALTDLADLGEILADPAIEKVFHDAKYDVMGLRRDFGFTLNNIFDTMVASRILGWRKYGLASILEERFGVTLNKRWQRANWARRPLPPEQLRYACLDSHYLLALREEQHGELVARGRYQEAREAFERQTKARWTKGGFDPEGFWKVKGARDLDGRGLAALKELYALRDGEAKKRDYPPFKVIPNAVLLALSSELPGSWEELSRVEALTPRLRQRYGRSLLEALKRAEDQPVPTRPKRNRSRLDEEAEARFEALKAWRKVEAERRGVEPDVVIPNEDLWQVARRGPHDMAALRATGALGPWALESYGEEIVAVLAGARRAPRRGRRRRAGKPPGSKGTTGENSPPG
jgi:ribonuclease D